MKWSIEIGRRFGLVGLLTFENITEMIMVNAALGNEPATSR